MSLVVAYLNDSLLIRLLIVSVQQSFTWLLILDYWMSSKTTKTTSKGKQDLINAEATCITKVLDDGTDTGLLEVLNQSQLITKQQRGVYAMMSQFT